MSNYEDKANKTLYLIIQRLFPLEIFLIVSLHEEKSDVYLNVSYGCRKILINSS
jgi:hypothetical protein